MSVTAVKMTMSGGGGDWWKGGETDDELLGDGEKDKYYSH